MIHARSRLVARVLRAAAAPAVVGALFFAPPGSHAAVAVEVAGGGWISADGSMVWRPAGTPGSFSYRLEVLGASADTLARARAENWDAAQWTQVLAVTIEPPGADPDVTLPPMLGTYRVEGAMLVFEPRFPLAPGATYRAVLRQRSESTGTLTRTSTTFRAPERPAQPATFVSAVYPTAEVLPGNTLKFYLHFSSPMKGGDVYRHLKLLDQDGREIDGAFLELPQELWNPEMTRFTLFLYPGRIKQDLAPNEEVGPPLTTGRVHTLVIDSAWPDASGKPLRETHRKTIRAADPDRTSPDPKKWTVTPPAPGSRAPLVIGFDESLDSALVRRLITVTGPDGRTVEGDITLTQNERSWELVPDDPWRAGEHHLAIGTLIEDLSGNSIAKPFEVDTFDQVHRSVTSETVTLPFTVR